VVVGADGRAAAVPGAAVIAAADIASELRGLGVARDDTLWVHAGLQTAVHVEGRTPTEKVDTLLDALDLAVPDGVLALPTFSYSFTGGEEYDIASSPSTVGVLSERFRSRPGVRRTADPIFSAAIRGRLPAGWAHLFEPGDTDCFGERSVFAYLRHVDAWLLFVGVGLGYCTFVYHLEQRLRVPYRYFKEFGGMIRDGDRLVPATARYFVRDLEADVENWFDPLADALIECGAARRARLPRGPALLITRARAIEAEATRRVRENPDFLLRRGHQVGAP
jgi:aminoglycoside 3-N-acetyltransferase